MTNFRSTPIALTESELVEVLNRYGFPDTCNNATGAGFTNSFVPREINGGSVVVDNHSGLMWQKSGSTEGIMSGIMIYSKAQEWVNNLNVKKFASFDDWRLPTVEEAMTLMETKAKNRDLRIDRLFDSTQESVWTCDKVSKPGRNGWVWVVNYNGYCYDNSPSSSVHVRVVRKEGD